jgi:hypothetical protein
MYLGELELEAEEVQQVRRLAAQFFELPLAQVVIHPADKQHECSTIF